MGILSVKYLVFIFVFGFPFSSFVMGPVGPKGPMGPIEAKAPAGRPAGRPAECRWGNADGTQIRERRLHADGSQIRRFLNKATSHQLRSNIGMALKGVKVILCSFIMFFDVISYIFVGPSRPCLLRPFRPVPYSHFCFICAQQH